MERLGHESRTSSNTLIEPYRSGRPIESFGFEKREAMERKYKADPDGFRARLIYQGFWYVAAQLKADFEAGRL